MHCRWHPSPNFSERRGGLVPRWVVIHYTAMPTAAAAIERLCAPEFEVSAHYVIDEQGAVTQLVDDHHRAWHAGRSYWQGVTDMNSASIGVELCNRGDHPFPEPQMRALRTVLDHIVNRWFISPRDIVGHSDIAMGRKSDPGARFDWRGLARDGFGLWPQPYDTACATDQFLGDAACFGYDTSAGVDIVLSAFRLRFAPHRIGPLSAQDCAEIASLARQMTVDRPPASS